MDTPRVDLHELAWAGGLHDGEGSCSAYLPKRRKTYRRQMAVSQGGDPGKPPLVLLGFRNAVGGVGNITGPYRGYLFYWKTTRIQVIDAIATALWPFLGQEKREQFLVVSGLAGKLLPLDLIAPRSQSDETERAWAAGFFDGEGSPWEVTTSYGVPTGSRRWRFRSRVPKAFPIPSSTSRPWSALVRSPVPILHGTRGPASRAIAGRLEVIAKSRRSRDSCGRGSAASSVHRSNGLCRWSMKAWFAEPIRAS